MEIAFLMVNETNGALRISTTSDQNARVKGGRGRANSLQCVTNVTFCLYMVTLTRVFKCVCVDIAFQSISHCCPTSVKALMCSHVGLVSL
jgi:hypothetical protein